MLMDATTPTSEPQAEPQAWPALMLHERRVLGVLVEKAFTTPDQYPLSLNAVVAGCNQKNNRDPVMNLTDLDVEEALAGLKQKRMVQQITGSGRVDKFKHTLYETLKVDKVPLAIIAELLLRGPQTEGELRGRANRMDPVPDLDQLRLHLRQLAQRGLVVYLSPEGRRGTMVTHGFHAPDELERLRARHEHDASEDATALSPTRAAVASPSTALAQRVEALEAEVAELRTELQRLRASLETRAIQNGVQH